MLVGTIEGLTVFNRFQALAEQLVMILVISEDLLTHGMLLHYI